MIDEPDLDRILERLSEEGTPRRDPDQHPGPERLAAYLANELSPQEDDDIQEHLADCRLCSTLLLDLQRFLEPLPEDLPAAGVADFETKAEWRRLRQRLPDEVIAPPANLREKRRIVLSPLAASLVLGLLLAPLAGVSWWNIRLREQVVKSRQPQGNVPTEVLASTRGEVHAISTGRAVDLDLETSAPQEYAEYLVEIKAQSGELLWSGTLRKDVSGKLTLSIPVGFWEPGLYQVRLSGLREGRAELLEEYEVRIHSE